MKVEQPKDIINKWISSPQGMVYYIVSYEGTTKGGQHLYDVIRFPAGKTKEIPFHNTWPFSDFEEYSSYWPDEFDMRWSIRSLFGE
jgi:hypothetical protein